MIFARESFISVACGSVSLLTMQSLPAWNLHVDKTTISSFESHPINTPQQKHPRDLDLFQRLERASSSQFIRLQSGKI